MAEQLCGPGQSAGHEMSGPVSIRAAPSSRASLTTTPGGWYVKYSKSRSANLVSGNLVFLNRPALAAQASASYCSVKCQIQQEFHRLFGSFWYL